MRISVLASGSSGNSILVECGGVKLLVDAGVSAKAITSKLNSLGIEATSIDAILVTHEHVDHVKGIEVFCRRHQVPVYARPAAWQAMPSIQAKMDPSLCRQLSDSVLIGDVRVEPFAIPHDAADPVGYCLYHEAAKISIATDLGFVTDSVYKALSNSDLMVLESNHDVSMLQNGAYPWSLKQRILSNRGHLSNDAAAWALTKLDRKKQTKVFLAHLSKENNLPQLAYDTVCGILERSGLEINKDIQLKMTYPDQVSSWDLREAN